MKIFHFIPSLESGGVEQVILELGKGFSERGHGNTVVSSGGRLVPELLSGGSNHITMDLGRKNLLTFLKLFAVRRLILREKPDVLHLHSRMPAWVAWLAWNTLPAKTRPLLVTTVHGFHSVNAYSAIVCRGQKVIAVSESVLDHILAIYRNVSRENVTVIPNAIDPMHFTPDFSASEEWKNEWHAAFPELKGKFTLCLPGRITRLKGHADLIPVLRTLHAKGIPAHAVLVGEAKAGKTAYLDEMRRRFSEAGLDNAVTWTGHRSDLKNILSICDVTLSLTSQPEAFGKTVLEALAMGRPVAGYCHGGVKELLTRFFPEGNITVGDTSALSERLANWYRTPPPPPKHVGAPYRLSDMIEAHLALYQNR